MIRASSNGNVLDVVETKNAEPGNTVYLTIDTKYQLLAQKALKEATKEAQDLAKQAGTKHSGEDCISGSVVMLDVKDFPLYVRQHIRHMTFQNIGRIILKLPQQKATRL